MRMPPVVAVAAVVLAASCTGAEDCTVSGSWCESYALALTLTPERLTLTVGDTASIGIAVTRGGRAARPSIRWTPIAPSVATVDSQTATQPRVRVHAIGAGASAIGFLVTVQGQTVQGAVPVTVSAR